MKKNLIVGSLLATGFLWAHDHNKVSENRLSYFERQALESQSPRVHTKGMEKHKKYDSEGVAKEQTRAGYRTVSTKSTVNAFVPDGK